MPETPETKKEESNIIEQVTKKRVPISEIWDYVDVPARLGEDLLHQSGVVLVPKGTEVSALVKNAKNLDKALANWGVSSLAIELHSQIDVREMEEAIRASENFVSIDSEFARETVKQVEDVYARIAEGACGADDVEKLVDSGKVLNKVASEAPEIMFCLGHVRESDEYTYTHSLNVGLLSSFVANKMFPDDKEFVECVSVAGVLHDLGKAKIPKEVLNKPGKLTDDEFAIMKSHAALGDEIAIGLGISDSRILSVIRGHHEKFSGGGYPDGFSKEGIRIEARIAAVADVFDALTARRVYKEPMASRMAMNIMLDDARLHFDPMVLRILLLSIGIYPPGTLVELSDMSIGVVVGSNGEDLIRPQVMLKIDSRGRSIDDIKIIDLKFETSLHVTKTLQSFEKLGF